MNGEREKEQGGPEGPAARRERNVVDLRPPADFAARRLAGSVNLPAPASGGDVDALADALPAPLLPPRHEALLVVGDDPEQVRTVVAFLRARGRPRTRGMHLTDAVLDGLPPGRVASGPCAARLWRPPPFLAEHADLLPPPAAGPVLDLGAGNGRAAVWLAMRGRRVTAVDRHPEALAKARLLAVREGVVLEAVCADLSRPESVPAGPWAAVLAFRFLERPLLARLPELLAPGGVAMVRTYRWEPGADLPDRRHCLEPGELPRLLPAERFETLVHVEDRDPDGAPAAGMVARLRSATS